jgi:shikimate kinase
VLVGLSGSGKSTVGRLLAERLGRRFVDTDDVIVARAGKPIPRVFAEDGEVAFRAVESAAVDEVLAGEPAVIATGGGAPVDPINRGKLWEGNLAVWLDAPVDVLVRRVGRAGNGRPLLAGDAAGRLAALRAVREAIYSTAHLRLDTTALGPHQAVDAILQSIKTQR